MYELHLLLVLLETSLAHKDTHMDASLALALPAAAAAADGVAIPSLLLRNSSPRLCLRPYPRPHHKYVH